MAIIRENLEMMAPGKSVSDGGRQSKITFFGVNDGDNDFYDVTGKYAEIDNYWGHIHEKNMSTRLHDHPNCFASGVVYISVPKGSGSIVFSPTIDIKNRDRFLAPFPPKRGRYYVFPGYLYHYVTRHNSDEMRVSLSFNLKKN